MAILIREGIAPYGDILFNIVGEHVHKGQVPWGDIVYTIDGDFIREG